MTVRRQLNRWYSLLPAVLLIAGIGAVHAQDAPPNVETPTLGGKQFWRDGFVHAGWRIQENVLIGHHRLLDPDDVRYCWGGFETCRARFEQIRQEREIRPRSTHLVLLVHGIARGPGTFSKLKPALIEAGYDAVAISYPSTRSTIRDHAEGLAALLARVEGSDRVSFVTHSMGGLVVRELLAGDAAWQQRLQVDRIVLIAPPNQGSQVAEWLEDVPLYRTLYGKAGQQLTPDDLDAMPGLSQEFAIIAGGKGDGEGFNPLLDGDDDGTVRVAATKLDGARDFLVVPALHAVVSNDRRSIAAIKSFLATGSFSGTAGSRAN